jgi:hypothetical protein
MTDTQLLVAIRGVLQDSPFVGEGHRKVWARLRRERGVYTSRKRERLWRTLGSRRGPLGERARTPAVERRT